MNEWILISQKENQLGLSWQLCKELLENRNIGQTEWMCEWSNKNYPYQLCVNFCILTTACIFGNHFYERGAILSKLSVNKHWRSNWLNHFSYIYFVNISSWCNFVFGLLSFDEGTLTRDTFDEIPWATKSSSLLLFCLSSLLNPALTERKECFQRAPNLGMPLSWCSSPLGGLPTLPTCGERAGRATGQDWADAAAELGPGEQPAEQMLGSPGKMWADAQEHQQDVRPELCLIRIRSETALLNHLRIFATERDLSPITIFYWSSTQV